MASLQLKNGMKRPCVMGPSPDSHASITLILDEACRPKSRVVGLLDLPAEILTLILSLVGTLSLAAVRLTCRALRDAVPCGRNWVTVNLDRYKATVWASPRVLQSIHTFGTLLDRLYEEQKEMEGSSSTPPDEAAFRLCRRFLNKQYIMDLAPEMQSLVIDNTVWAIPSYVREWAVKPEVLLAQMQLLESLHGDGPLEGAILRELPALEYLTSLTLSITCSNDALREICSKLCLSHLNLGSLYVSQDRNAFDFQRMLATLGEGSLSFLQKLLLPLPAGEAGHLSRLTPLTSLTALEVNMWGTAADLGGLGNLTGLESLQLAISYESEDNQPVIRSLNPLTALTGLNCLQLYDRSDNKKMECSLPCSVSSLSSLSALRLLCCSFFGTADIIPGDPLPVQLRFLRTATALQGLHLGFWGSFWSLPDASSLAIQEAVSALSSLQHVGISVLNSGSEQYYAPLRVFAAATSITSFSFTDLGPIPGPLAAYSRAQAHGCFKALSNVRTLMLGACGNCRYVPCCVDLLAGLPSNRLDVLHLHVGDVPLELVQEIARFRDLQVLELTAVDVDSTFLGQLSDLKCLSRLVLNAGRYQDRWDISSGISAQAAQLKAAIRERARRLGGTVDVHVWEPW